MSIERMLFSDEWAAEALVSASPQTHVSDGLHLHDNAEAASLQERSCHESIHCRNGW